MKFESDHIEKINEVNRFIMGLSDWFDEQETLIIDNKRANEILSGEDKDPEFEYNFPGEDNYTYLKAEQLLELHEDILSLEIVNNGLVKTRHRRYYISGDISSYDYHLLHQNFDTEIRKPGIKIDFVSESFFVGLAAAKLGEHEDHWGTIGQYYAIEIIYYSEENILSPEEEKELIDTYIFEVTDSTGIAIHFGEIQCPSYYDEEDEDNGSNFSLRELEPYNEGMKLFVSAVSIDEPGLKFLYFYKVLEHFSPVAINIEANELMRKKLDAPRREFVDGDYIKSIFELANSVQNRSNDEDLIKAAFNTCFDFVGLFSKLPEFVRKHVNKTAKLNELSYQTDKSKIRTACNIVGGMVYTTRNREVHSKSNFQLKGVSIPREDLNQLNVFMKEASSQAIRWYNRQPRHLMLEVIK